MKRTEDCIVLIKDVNPYLSLDSNGDYEPTINDFLDFDSDIKEQKSKLSTVIDAEGLIVFIASEAIARWLCKLANEYFDKEKKIERK